MKVLIKFDYENKTYYVYQVGKSIKYGTSDDIYSISATDKNIINEVLNLLKPSKYLINLTPFIFNGKKFDIYLDTKTNFRLFYPIPSEDEIVKLNIIFNDQPFEFNIEFNDKEKEFIRKTINYSKKTVVVFIATTLMVMNLSFFPDIVNKAKLDVYTTHIQEVASTNKTVSDDEFLSKINSAIANNNNLSNEEKVFMTSNSFFFLDNKEYIDLDSLVDRLSTIKIEYSPFENNENIKGQYLRVQNTISVYESSNFETSAFEVLTHEFMHACQQFGYTNYNSFLVETVNNITTSEYYGKDSSYSKYIDYTKSLIEILGSKPFKRYQCYPKEGLIVNELSKIIESPTKAIKLLNDLDNYKSLTSSDVVNNKQEAVILLKEEIYNSIKNYYEAKYHRSMENDLIMLYYLDKELFTDKIKEEYNLDGEYNIIYVKDKCYLNSVLVNSNDNNLLIFLEKQNSNEKPIKIELNESNRLVENKLVK